MNCRSTQVFYAGERKSPYITDAAGKVIQLIPPPKSTGTNDPSTVQKLSNGETAGTSANPNSSQDR